MTAQINDSFRYRNKEYSIAGIIAGELFDISALGLKPAARSTNCWRGYQAVFAVAESRLVLDALRVNLTQPSEGKGRSERQVGPPINGVTPSRSKGSSFFNNHYDGLSYHIDYSGGVLLAHGFIRSLYVHMGFHPAWKYKTVFELVFEAGVLKEEFDRSERIAEIREMVTSPQKEVSSETMSREDIRQFVERAFDRSYRW